MIAVATRKIAAIQPSDPVEPAIELDQAFPVGAGRGATGVAVVGGGDAVTTGVGAGVACCCGVTGVVGAGVTTAAGATVGTGVGATIAGAGVGAGVGVAATTTMFETSASQITSAPPPFAESLHWSMLTGSVDVIVEAPDPVHVKPTLVPPLPDPLHWPIVAAPIEVMPAVLVGVQLPGAPVPVITDPTHPYAVAATMAPSGVPLKWLVIVAEQRTVPPPPFAEPLHCWTLETGSLEVRVVVVQVSVLTGPDAPTHREMTTVDGGVAASVPLAVRWFVTMTVQATCMPPAFCSPLHCDAGAALTGLDVPANSATATISAANAIVGGTVRSGRRRLGDLGVVPFMIPQLSSAFLGRRSHAGVTQASPLRRGRSASTGGATAR